MSYILDALKKLEQKRRQEETVTLLAPQGLLQTKPKPRRVWVYVVLAALILNAAAIAWWIAPWKPAAKNIPRKTAVVREAKPSSPPAERKMETEYVASKQLPPPEVKQVPPDPAGKEGPGVPKPAQKTAPAAVQPPSPGGKAQTQSPAASPKPVAAQKSSPAEHSYSEPATPSEPKPPRDGRVHRIGDLPVSVSSGLPEFRMSLHYYIGDTKTRFARINDKTLREGETFGEGVKVDEITPAGVVLNYRGWRFLLPISNEK